MHRCSHRISLSLAVLLAILAVAGCGSPPAASGSVEPTAAGLPASTPGSAGIHVTDAAGRAVALPELPQRIVVAGRSSYMILHLLYMFPEARQRLVGMAKQGETASDFLPLIDPGFQDKPTLEGGAGPEQIAALEPDLVLMKSAAVEQMSKSLDPLGISLAYVGLETPDQFFQDVANLGTMLGNQARAAEISGFYQARLDRIQQSLAGLAEDDKPRVLLLEYSDRGNEVAVQVPARSWMQTIQVQLAGGAPVWLEAAQVSDGWTVTNLEQIALWDPDQIYVVVWYALDPEQVIASLHDDPQWSKLKAVQNDEIYAFPSDLYGWDTPEPRWLLGVTWLAGHIHPERFPDLDMTEEIYAFFGQLYGMTRADVEADILPMVHLDVH
jgi:iron complex transport system substrate-binding protein